MTFDEAIKKAKEDSFVEEMLSDVVDLEDVIELLENIKKEYAPTVEMTKEYRNTLRFYLENRTFFSLIERKHAFIEVEMLGITSGSNEFLNLSDEDLMQAWLHPETIKVVDN